MSHMDTAFWKQIIREIENLVLNNIYEQANIVMSLGMSTKLRRLAINELHNFSRILDVGCGPCFSLSLLKNGKTKLILCLDPSEKMIKRVPGDAERIIGIAEMLPLRSKSFDASIAMFSFRDFLNKGKGLSEMIRVSRNRIILLDVFRPSKTLSLILVSIYISSIAPFLAWVISRGRKGGWKSIYRTFLLMPSAEELVKVLGGKIIYSVGFGTLTIILKHIEDTETKI